MHPPFHTHDEMALDVSNFTVVEGGGFAKVRGGSAASAHLVPLRSLEVVVVVMPCDVISELRTSA